MRPRFDKVIAELDLLGHLAEFSPMVIGTPPLGIATEESDIDIACSAADLDKFVDAAQRKFGHFKGFSLSYVDELNEPATLASFLSSGWEIELFCQRLNTDDQWGVRHFRVEQRLLMLAPRLRQDVLRLEQRGIKTESAFAEVLRLAGDPFEAVLALEEKSDEELRELIDQHFVSN